MASRDLLESNPAIKPLIKGGDEVSSDTMVFSFPSTLIKRLILVVKQKNYRTKSNVTDAWDIEKANLWAKLSDDTLDNDARFELYLDSADGGFKNYV
jgi:hypothetical protein